MIKEIALVKEVNLIKVNVIDKKIVEQLKKVTLDDATEIIGATSWKVIVRTKNGLGQIHRIDYIASLIVRSRNNYVEANKDASENFESLPQLFEK